MHRASLFYQRPHNTMNKKLCASLFPTTSSSSVTSSWSHLPPELLDQIFHLLSISDRQRVRLICSPWRGVARQPMTHFPLPFEPPRLLLTQPDNSISFFDLFNSKSLSFSLHPSFCQARCFGYLAGWFFLVSDQMPSHACLFNPVLNAEIPFPDLEFPIVKATLSAPPGFPNCVVAVLGRSTSIALCELAGKVWQVLDLEKRVFGDILFWQKRLCAMEINGNTNVLICNFDMESRRTGILTVPLPPQWSDSMRWFLVESISGDLLAVVQTYNYMTKTCHNILLVFKLHLQSCTWEKLELIGDQALFLGCMRSESVPVNRFPGSGLRENSIYCTSWKFESCLGVAVIYSMVDEAMTPLPVSGRYSIVAEPVWVSPVIWP